MRQTTPREAEGQEINQVDHKRRKEGEGAQRTHTLYGWFPQSQEHIGKHAPCKGRQKHGPILSRIVDAKEVHQRRVGGQYQGQAAGGQSPAANGQQDECHLDSGRDQDRSQAGDVPIIRISRRPAWAGQDIGVGEGIGKLCEEGEHRHDEQQG